MKKKRVSVVNYVKGTEAENKNEILDLVKDAKNLFVLQQAIYSDGSQSMTIEIHFNPK